MSSEKTTTIAVPRPSRGRRLKFKALALKVLSGPDAGLELTLSLPIIRIGTALDNDLILHDRSVSRHHAEIRSTPEGYLFRDLGSTNGSFIESLRVTEAILGMEVTGMLGRTQILLRQLTEEHEIAVAQENQLGPLVGGSQPMRELYGFLRAVAPTLTTLLIQGESGSGKELVARTLHHLSRRNGPFVVFDASVTDRELIRSDLFGHTKGAFTGAAGSREGAFRKANQGTLFIDEIGELPLELQPRLLRALENREVTPLGSDQPVRVDVRVIAATHRNLAAMVQAGTFRADLFYRLSVIIIDVPPLRDIPEDIPLLVQHFLKQRGLDCHLTPAALKALQTYSWPGNIRELRNVLERAAALTKGNPIHPQDLHFLPLATAERSSSKPPPSQPPAGSQLKTLERQMIQEALARNRYNKAATARELGISLSTLKRRLKEYAIPFQKQP
ncbi:sigma 54-interacting transcriptional regulator [Nitrosococcus wardiae]|uniref:Sigma 54-dependent Fis family transcriptional regulator n=1 Tax=Nitrosococcus wardiae TaxID=1814290 RepID=A0A4P7BTA3_9GAMM|nr:sigma 54-interacting transcriptional regulator [Nitrosococcus wardiae]QBQ53091.1 sigma 54-dependent Fis family transcriptional regulator [Nitrosococcus wardiae]